MLLYCYPLSHNIITLDEVESIQLMSQKNESKFIDYVSQYGHRDNNKFLTPFKFHSFYHELPFIKKLVSGCSLKTFPVIMKHTAGSTVRRHIDDHKDRRTLLSIPICPEVNYPPTYFWETMESIEPIAIATFDTMLPCLFNTTLIHGLTNTHESDRINLQFCFSEPIELVAELFNSKKLFN